MEGFAFFLILLDFFCGMEMGRKYCEVLLWKGNGKELNDVTVYGKEMGSIYIDSFLYGKRSRQPQCKFETALVGYSF